jgi:hypothetical protein
MMLNVCVLLETRINFHIPARSGRVSELGRVDAGQGAMQSQSHLDGMQSYNINKIESVSKKTWQPPSNKKTLSTVNM